MTAWDDSFTAALRSAAAHSRRMKALDDNGLARLFMEELWCEYDVGCLEEAIINEAVRRLRSPLPQEIEYVI